MAAPIPSVLGIGELLWDNLPDGRQLGGAPANFAYHVYAHGLPAAPVSAIGKDRAGDDLLTALRQRGVETGLIATVDYPTGQVDVKLDQGGKPTYHIRTDVAWDHIPLTDDLLAIAGSARAVCYGSLAQRAGDSRRTIHALLDATPRDCLRVFDVNLRAPHYEQATVRSGLEACNVFKLSDEEIEEVAKLVKLPTEEAAFAEQAIERFGLKLLVITHGDKGSLLQTPEQRHPHPGVKVNVVSTVGAGDSFTAAVVAGMLNGLPLAEVHDLAARVAAYVCTQPGAMPTLPDELRVSNRMT